MRDTKNYSQSIPAASLLEGPTMPSQTQDFANQSDILTRQAAELSRLDVRVAELLLCLHSIPPLPGSAPPRACFLGEDDFVGFHPL
jgi:hypothetical protein